MKLHLKKVDKEIIILLAILSFLKYFVATKFSVSLSLKITPYLKYFCMKVKLSLALANEGFLKAY